MNLQMFSHKLRCINTKVQDSLPVLEVKNMNMVFTVWMRVRRSIDEFTKSSAQTRLLGLI